jgi:isoquinoline 1-oxidoreductase beta subunit
MLIAAVAACPYFGGKVRSADLAAARRVRGVRQVLNLGDLVAVLADHNGAARKGLAAANVQWDQGPAAGYSTATMESELAAASRQEGATARVQGDVAAARASGARTIEAIYQQPLMAHAAMEPMNCTVRLTRDRCEVWTGTQVPTRAQAAAAQAAGLKPEQVEIHNQYLGGGFGRRLDVDVVPQAVRIAKAARVPVKVVWSREEDIQHDVYRPYHYNRLSATLDAQGHPVAWQHRVTGSSIMARFAPAFFKDNIDGDAIRDAAGPYDFAHLQVQYVRQEPPAGLSTGWWRGVGHMQNAFPVECFLDELAHETRQDPLQMRLTLLDKHPRAQQVLRLLADKAQWGRPVPAGQGRGLALTQAFGTYAAQVTDVAVQADGTVRVLRVVTVVDCGMVVTPSTVEAQVQGGNVFGLSAALFGNITIKDGRIEQSNFHDFRVMRMNEVPVMDTYIVPSAEAPTGIGEIATVLSAPSVVNAVFAATGRRVRKLPLDPETLRA